MKVAQTLITPHCSPGALSESDLDYDEHGDHFHDGLGERYMVTMVMVMVMVVVKMMVVKMMVPAKSQKAEGESSERPMVTEIQVLHSASRT